MYKLKIKNMRTKIKLMTVLFVAMGLFAFKGRETKTLVVKSSTVCDMCKQRIERGLVFEEGVKEVKVDIAANTISVKYKADKTTPEKIKTAISKLGYSADEVAADETAFKKLPMCCQKEGCGMKK